MFDIGLLMCVQFLYSLIYCYTALQNTDGHISLWIKRIEYANADQMSKYCHVS